MTMQYNNPAGGVDSTIGGEQMNTFLYQRKALTETRKKQVFTQLSDTFGMPKHMGKEIKRYVYLPLLDDANINDQGIDANGATVTQEVTIELLPPENTSTGNGYVTLYAVGEGSSAANALAAAKTRALDYFKEYGIFDTDYNTSKAAAVTAGWTIVDTLGAVAASGNLYGSSKDMGKMVSKMPLLSENGGRVNRVGFKRVQIKGSIEKMGFFDEYTKESMDFDSDSEKQMHINREMLNGALEITEDAIQIDLINGAGVVRFGGEAMATNEVTGEVGGLASEITYEDLMRLGIDLDNNRCPKNTKLITGTRMVDTRVINGARYLYIGSELKPMFKRMADTFGNQAFISVEKYAAGAGSIAEGEIGSVDEFRIIVVPEMAHWAGEGAPVTDNAGFRETGGNYDVFPALVVGSESFVTIGFQTAGKTVKFKIKHVAPESEASYGAHDPYGELGFMSIKWYYGMMILRPERIALLKCVASW